MIKFSLHCSQSHDFEGWFASNDEFDRLKKIGHVNCPVCGDGEISKSLMAPSVQTSRKKSLSAENVPAPTPKVLTGEDGGKSSEKMVTFSPEKQGQVLEQIRQFRKQLTENAEDVGKRFSEEARKIHFGEAKERRIYGKANARDAVELIEEGIPVLPLPALPEDNN